MPALQTLIKAEPQSSPIDIICEANPQHITRKFVMLQVKGAHVVEEMNSARNVDDPSMKQTFALSMRVCPTCWVEYLGFVNNVANNLK